MWFVIKRISLGMILIVIASSVLLFSDRERRKSKSIKVPHIAIVQFTSSEVSDEAIDGVLEGLRQSGYEQNRNIKINTYNAEGDFSTANLIADEVTGGKFSLIITLTTPILQAVANANRKRKTPHVFGIVTDPFGAGVGINEDNPLDHPENMVGTGLNLPVADAFRMAKRLYPDLTSVGLVWNTAEANSLAYTREARKISKELGIDLVEANVENSSGVHQSAASLLSSGVESIFISGDSTVSLAYDTIISTAKKGGIPAFSIIPREPGRGTLFDLGANWYKVGLKTGQLAGEILNGKEPASIPIENYVPKRLEVNKNALKGLKDPWHLPDDVIESADVVVDETGIHDKKADYVSKTERINSKKLKRKWKLRIIEYTDVLDVEECRQGVIDGLRGSGLVEGKDYLLKIQNAQSDMATVNIMVDSALSEGADMLITLSTPTLQAALNKARGIPIIFTYISDPIAAGAGISNRDHLPNVTGVYMASAYEEMLEIIKKLIPETKALGTLFVSSEVNSVFQKDRLTETSQKDGLEVVAIAADTSAEVPAAALALCNSNINAICLIPGNLTASAFPSIARAANSFKLPIFAFQSIQAHQGATVVIARDYYDAGKEAAFIAARVMRGEDPGSIPFEPVSKTRLLVNLDAARAANLELPESLIKKADEIIGN